MHSYSALLQVSKLYVLTASIHFLLTCTFVVITGRFNPKKPDPKKWKANFRCALNSLGEAVEMKTLSKKKGVVAFKIYQLFDKKQNKQRHKGTLLVFHIMKRVF